MANRKKKTSAPPDQQQLDLPQPPPFQRKIEFQRTQLIGVPLLMLLPLLALFGLFGETFTTVSAENEQLSMQVEYATRYRYKMVNDMIVSVTNLSATSPATVTVAFGRTYLDQFSTQTFTPSATRLTDEAYEVELTEIGAGETQVVRIELQGERYLYHAGVVSASITGGEALQFSVGTTIFP